MLLFSSQAVPSELFFNHEQEALQYFITETERTSVADVFSLLFVWFQIVSKPL